MLSSSSVTFPWLWWRYSILRTDEKQRFGGQKWYCCQTLVMETIFCESNVWTDIKKAGNLTNILKLRQFSGKAGVRPAKPEPQPTGSPRSPLATTPRNASGQGSFMFCINYFVLICSRGFFLPVTHYFPLFCWPPEERFFKKAFAAFSWLFPFSRKKYFWVPSCLKEPCCKRPFWRLGNWTNLNFFPTEKNVRKPFNIFLLLL